MKEKIKITIDVDVSDVADPSWLATITKEFDQAMHRLGYYRVASSKQESILFTYQRFAVCSGVDV